MQTLYMERTISTEQLDAFLQDHGEKRRKLQDLIRLQQLADPETLEEERLHRLPELFAQIRERSLSQPDYEMLFRESVRCAVVRSEQVEFDTPHGLLTLPRLRNRKCKYLPSWKLLLPRGMSETDLFLPGHPRLEICFQIGEPHLLLETPGLVYLTS